MLLSMGLRMRNELRMRNTARRRIRDYIVRRWREKEGSSRSACTYLISDICAVQIATPEADNTKEAPLPP